MCPIIGRTVSNATTWSVFIEERTVDDLMSGTVFVKVSSVWRDFVKKTGGEKCGGTQKG